MKHSLISLLMAAALSVPAVNAASILDLRHSITDNNVVPPESFETKTRELEENFYLQNFVVRDKQPRGEKLGTPAEYEQRLSQLPTVIEMPYNSVVGRFIDMYLGKKRNLVSDMLALHSYYGNIFLEELIKEGMPTELQYLPVIESAINPNAVSRAGAAGLWQFMPGTAKGLGMEVNSLVDERRDPRSSSRNAAKYLKQLYNIYDDWSLAIAAYNCGPGNVNKALRRAGGEGKKDFWTIYNYLPAETRGYVPAFIAANYVMNYYNNHNINPTVVKRHLTTDTVYVNNRVHFQQIADVLNIPIEEIRMLNPQYVKDIIPAGAKSYALTLPKQQCLSYLMSEEAILAHDADLYAQRTYVEPGGARPAPAAPADSTANPVGTTTVNAQANVEIATAEPVERVVKKTHIVGRGENIRDIAKLYGVSATDIKRWNNLRRGKVKEGDELTIEVIERVMTAPAVAAVTPTRNPGQNTAPVPPPPAKPKTTPAAPVPPRPAATTPAKPAPAKTVTPAKPAPAKKDKPATTPAKKKETKPKTTKHTVKEGESLERIARANGTTVDEIRRANKMKKDETMIRPGQDLVIPGKKAPAKTTPAKKTPDKKTDKKAPAKKTPAKKKK